MGNLDRWTDSLLGRQERLTSPRDAELYDPGSDNITIHLWPMCSRPEWTRLEAQAAVMNAATAEQEGGLHVWVEIGEWSPAPVLCSPPSAPSAPEPPARRDEPPAPPAPKPYKPGTGAEDVWHFGNRGGLF